MDAVGGALDGAELARRWAPDGGCSDRGRDADSHRSPGDCIVHLVGAWSTLLRSAFSRRRSEKQSRPAGERGPFAGRWFVRGAVVAFFRSPGSLTARQEFLKYEMAHARMGLGKHPGASLPLLRELSRSLLSIWAGVPQ